MANSVRTRGVDRETLQSSPTVSVLDEEAALAFVPVSVSKRSGLVFVCGAGVAAEAYAPLLRPVAEAGHPVFVVRLPRRFAPLESDREEAVLRAIRIMESRADISRWVIAGHSLGGALACRVAKRGHARLAAMVLIGTTHPREDDLSALSIPVTKVYGSNDGVAPKAWVLENRSRLPKQTKWVEITGGNHSQFGHYGHQLFDGSATLARENQQLIARAALLDSLVEADIR